MARTRKLPLTKENILQLLEALGDTERKVFASLRRRKIHGKHGSTNCPVAVYLVNNLELPESWRLHVSDAVNIYDDRSTQKFQVRLPSAVSNFVRSYDTMHGVDGATVDYSALYGEPTFR